MIRLFVALAIPEGIAQSLMLLQGGVPGTRWQTREQLHLTLRFIGEVDGSDLDAIDDTLAGIMAPDFTLQLHGVGQFGMGREHKGRGGMASGQAQQQLWAGVRPNPALEHLQRKVDTAIRRVGQPQDAHKFTPHVTLGRLRHADTEKVVDWLTYHALYTSAEFAVEAFGLYSSHPTGDGSVYAEEEFYPLGGHDDQADD
jgi:2'-5' RNA ligase